VQGKPFPVGSLIPLLAFFVVMALQIRKYFWLASLPLVALSPEAFVVFRSRGYHWPVLLECEVPYASVERLEATGKRLLISTTEGLVVLRLNPLEEDRRRELLADLRARVPRAALTARDQLPPASNRPRLGWRRTDEQFDPRSGGMS
jgi:hypothetical protein